MATTHDTKVMDNKTTRDSENDAPAYVKPEHSHESDSTSLESGTPFDVPRTKKLLRKLDFHLVPFLALLYLYVYLGIT